MDDTRKKLIQILLEQNGNFISGQELSKQLNITRSAIWKHMSELKKEGYLIEGVTNKGYRLIDSPNNLSPYEIKLGLQTKWLGRELMFFEQVDSTQTIGHELAHKGNPHGTVILASHQSNGRGRMKRYWDSKAGRGLWFSTILRPEQLEPKKAPQLTLVAAVAVSTFLKELNLHPQIKWPNDILLDGKKVCGILTEMQAEQDSIDYILLGIGLNVSHKREDFHVSIQNKATSLYLHSKIRHNINNLFQNLLLHLEKQYEIYMAEGFSVIKEVWESFALKYNEWVKIKTNKTFLGKIIGIHEDGALIVVDENRNEHVLYSAEIFFGEDV